VLCLARQLWHRPRRLDLHRSARRSTAPAGGASRRRAIAPSRTSPQIATAAVLAISVLLATSPASADEPPSGESAPVPLAPTAGASSSAPPADPPRPDAEPRILHPDASALGELAWGRLTLRPSLLIETAGFAEGNAGFGGRWAIGPVADSKVYFEHANQIGLDARFDLGRHGSLRGRVSGVFSMTGGGIDAGASNASDINVQAYTLEDAALTWESGDALPALGHDAVSFGIGNQHYQVFDGLLFWIGASTGGPRGALWISPRKAFRETAVARLTTRGVTVEGFHLKYDDDPDTDTRLAGGRVEVTASGTWVRSVTAGLCYFNLYESKTRSRDGLNGIYAYQAMTPLPRLPELSWTASFVQQLNSEAAGLSDAVGYALSPSYAFPSLPWSPQLWYRFASFSGGTTRNFDPLFTGLSDWGSWFQGELLGEFVLGNSNLDSHLVRVEVQPDPDLTLNLLYYKFLLSDLDQSFGPTPKRVSSAALADEIDLIAQLSLTEWWSILTQLTVAVPDRGFREAVGGSSTWINGMVYFRLRF
jgi:hypothetical protein